MVEFKRFPIAPMKPDRINDYVKRWLSAQVNDEDVRREVKDIFEKRQHESHVQALIKNPMQLSVLLHFIQMKGAAFPDYRAELYKQYFNTVIDRDVEKSSDLREKREIVEALHRFLGYKIHALTEAKQVDGSLTRQQLMQLVMSWLALRGEMPKAAHDLFKLGEERLGLIVALKGEGEETRYGYEIQPIREYFAAAYINDDIKGEAHNIFEVMMRRPYWGEVALFLAGLRRPNEKADLIARAKALDENEELGWRQDGRNVIFQLLQEGVFSHPPYLFSNALDFIFEMLDPKLVKLQNEPKDFLKVLPTLINQESIKKRYEDRLIGFLRNYKTSTDEYLIYRLYWMASHLIDKKKIHKEILSYRGECPYLIVKVRFLWPTIWKVDMRDAIQQSSFWEGISDEICSDATWASMVRMNNSSNFSVLPSHFHRYLLERFAVNFPLIRSELFNSKEAKTLHSNWAIQVLSRCQGMIFSLDSLVTAIHSDTSDRANEVTSLLDSKHQINFTGLDNYEQSTVDALIKISQDILKAALAERNQLSDAYENYVLTIRKYLNEPGLTSWLAFRCAFNIFFSIALQRRTSISDYLLRHPSTDALWKDLKVLLPEWLDYPQLEDKTDEIFQFFHFLVMSPYPALNMTPGYIRLEKDSGLVSLVDLIANYINEGKEFPFSWIKYVSFLGMIHTLIVKCKDNLPKLLKTVNNNFSSFYNISKYISILDGESYSMHTISIPSLSASDIQRVLKVMRNSNDADVLTGGLIVLSSSKFVRSAGVDLTLKMMQASFNRADLAANLFSRESFEEHNRDSRELITEIAKRILQSPDEYALAITSGASQYLAEHSSSDSQPLLYMGNGLKLYGHI